jgi:hypothetical protein
VIWAERPIASTATDGEGVPVLQALLLVGGLLPLAAMLVALFVAAWLRQSDVGQGRREELAPAPRQ